MAIQVKRSSTAKQLSCSASIGAIALALPALFATAAAAQASPQDDTEEVIVSGKFISTDKTSSNKLGADDLDTPTSVSAYTEDFMKAIETTEVSDLYRYMTGLQRAGSTGYDMTLRGFRTTIQDRNAIMTDGLPGQAVRFGSPPVIGTDHIEVVKGPASLYYGQVQPGGFVNIITKKPSVKAMTELTVTGALASDNRADGGILGVDSTGAIDSAGEFLYRVIGEKSDEKTFRDHGYERANYVAPSFTWTLDESTVITAQYEYRNVETNYNNVFLFAPLNNVRYIGSYRNNYSAPSDWQTESGTVGQFSVLHSFANGIDWTTSFRDVEHYDKAHAFDVAAATNAPLARNALIPLRARGQSNYREYAFGDSNLSATIPVWVLSNRIVLGVTAGRETDDLARTQFAPTKYTVLVNNPDFTKVASIDTFPAGTRQDQKTKVQNEGAYVSDLITIDEHWKAQLGTRFTREMGKFEDPLNIKTNPPRAEANNSVTKTAGVIYEPTKTWSIYADYSTSFAAVPMTSVGLTQNGLTNYRFHPTTGVSYEVGTKFASDDDRLTVTLAGFRIDRQHVAETYAQSPGTPNLCPVAVSASCVVSVGAERSTGAELEVVAKPVKEWQIIAGYAYTDAKVQSNEFAPTTVGNTLANSPENAAHLWSRYDFAGGILKGFGIGVGGSYTGDRVAYNGSQLVANETKLPHYAVFDTVLYYDLAQKVALTFKVNNIFNKIYYESGNTVSNLLSIQPGQPRIMMLSGRVEF